MTAATIYEYLDYRAFVRDWFTAKKEANPRFSHRAFVRKTGQKSPSFLADVMEGRRNLTQATTSAVSGALGLNTSESRFFEALVSLDQAKRPEQRQDAWERLTSFRKFRQARQLEDEAISYLSHWYFPAIRELANRSDLIPDPAWIARTLDPPITPAQAQRALDALRHMGMLVKGAKGRLELREVGLRIPNEVATVAMRNYHRGMLDQAKEAIDRFEKDRRHFCSVTAAIPTSLIPRFKEELDALLERLVAHCEESEREPDQVIQLNLNFFPMSKPAAQSRPKTGRR